MNVMNTLLIEFRIECLEEGYPYSEAMYSYEEGVLDLTSWWA